jgi:hypothetical protein
VRASRDRAQIDERRSQFLGDALGIVQLAGAWPEGLRDDFGCSELKRGRRIVGPTRCMNFTVVALPYRHVEAPSALRLAAITGERQMLSGENGAR